MAKTYTVNYGFTKDDPNDPYNVDIVNDNLDAIDSAIKGVDNRVLTDVPANAKFTDTVYTHPSTAGNKHIPTGGSANQILKYSASGTAIWSDLPDPAPIFLQGKTTTFVGNTITETYVSGDSLITTFNANGTITEVHKKGSVTISTKTTTFNPDGSITEVIL